MFPHSDKGIGTLLLEDSARQKKDVSNAIFLKSSDQLRQRVAFALSQILVVTPIQVRTIHVETILIEISFCFD